MPNNHMQLTTVIYDTDQKIQESQLMRDKSKCHENKKCSSRVETKLRKNTGNKSRGLGGRLIVVVRQSGRQNFCSLQNFTAYQIHF